MDRIHQKLSAITLILSTALITFNVKAFSVIPRLSPIKMTIQTTALRYTIIGPPDEDPGSVPQDPNSVDYMPTISENGAVADLSQYRDYDETMEEDVLGVDSFSHTAGQSIMPGFHLTALCGDD